MQKKLTAIKIEKQDPEKYDNVYVEITHNNKKQILATANRPPNLREVDDIPIYNEIPCPIQGKNAIVIGDFNCANVDWGLLIGDKEGSRLINMVEDSFHEFTRYNSTNKRKQHPGHSTNERP